MEYVTNLQNVNESIDKGTLDVFTVCLAPVAPHLAEELWHDLGHESSVMLAHWPTVDEQYLVDDEVIIVVQVNGKVRDRIQVARGATEHEVVAVALKTTSVQSSLEGKTLSKKIYVQDKILNFVVR